MIIDITDEKKLEILSIFLKGMNLTSKILTQEEKEDLGLITAMKEVDRTKKISRSKVMDKLTK